MRIINPAARCAFSGLLLCELCRQPCAGTETAHIFGRGAGQVDHAINTVGACKLCHDASHYNGRVTRTAMLDAVCLRERGWTAKQIEDVIQEVRRADKRKPHLICGDGRILCGNQREASRTCLRPIDIGCPLCRELWARNTGKSEGGTPT